jgi:hypothetical protein
MGRPTSGSYRPTYRIRPTHDSNGPTPDPNRAELPEARAELPEARAESIGPCTVAVSASASAVLALP